MPGYRSAHFALRNWPRPPPLFVHLINESSVALRLYIYLLPSSSVFQNTATAAVGGDD